jgi:ketosteroid isomerase-like protein
MDQIRNLVADRAAAMRAGDVATLIGLHRLSMRPTGAPDTYDLWFRVTYGLRKVDGDWKIIHEHQSTPFHMDGSLKAAVDLEP